MSSGSSSATDFQPAWDTLRSYLKNLVKGASEMTQGLRTLIALVIIITVLLSLYYYLSVTLFLKVLMCASGLCGHQAFTQYTYTQAEYLHT